MHRKFGLRSIFMGYNKKQRLSERKHSSVAFVFYNQQKIIIKLNQFFFAFLADAEKKMIDL